MSRGRQINPPGKRAITEALFYLMDKKSFSSITVKEIVETAQVARATYYRNFYYKEDIIRNFLQVMKSEFMVNLQNTPIILEDVHTYLEPELLQNSLELAFTLCLNNKFYILAIVKNGLGSLIQNVLNDYAQQITNSQYKEERYQLYFIQGAAYNMVVRWLMEGAEESPRKMTDKLLSYLKDGVIKSN